MADRRPKIEDVPWKVRAFRNPTCVYITTLEGEDQRHVLGPESYRGAETLLRRIVKDHNACLPTDALGGAST